MDGRWLHAPAKAVRGLFDSWVSVSAPCRWTALHAASFIGHSESVKALLEKGAAVNAADDAKCAFFLFAVLDGRRLPAPARLCAVRHEG